MKVMDLRNFSKDPGGYMKKIKHNEIVKVLRGMQPRCSKDDRTLSKKDRGVKILELRGNRRRRLMRLLDIWI